MDNKQRKQELLSLAKEAGRQQDNILRTDFDEIVKLEKEKGKCHEFKFEGKVYKFLPGLPARIVFDTAENPNAVIDETNYLHLLKSVMGQEFHDAVRNSEYPFVLIEKHIITPILKSFNYAPKGSDIDEDDSGNEQTPAS
jgi:hypothetical protein